jgi:uncharacterized protein YndB with AHSA1/START domain
MQEDSVPFAGAEMLIRKPPKEVFEAFIDPAVTTNFWFTHASGKLEVGKRIVWEWDMYQISVPVIAKEIVAEQKIVLDWGAPARTVVFQFTPMADSATYVSITETGYREKAEALIAAIRDSTGGFTTVLDGLKAFLEHGIRLKLIEDKFPAAIASRGR